jgi:hypothetical protein
MEGGIKTNDDNIVDAQNAILTLQGEMLQAQGDISALETLVDSIFPVDTESGNPAVITDAFGGACKSLKLTLEPIQSGSGTPSPQNVRPIIGRTQSVVTRTGKNIISVSEIEQGGFNNGVPQRELTIRCSIYRFIKVSPGEKLTLSATATKILKGVLIYYRNNANDYSGADGNSGFSALPHTYTIPDDIEYVCIGFGYTDDTNITSSAISNAQLEIGSTTTAYEPYNGESITRTYGTTIYGGSDDVTGEGAVSEYGLVEFDGSVDENWQTGLAPNCFSTARGEVPADLAPSKYITSSFEPSDSAVTGKMYVGTNYINVCYTAVIANVTDWRTYLSSHPLQICYKLTTPTSIPLTAQNITLLHGDNVLTTDADSIECEYSADIALYIDKKIAEGSQNNRNLSKGGSSDEESKEEEKEEVKEEEIEIKEAEPLTKEVR